MFANYLLERALVTINQAEYNISYQTVSEDTVRLEYVNGLLMVCVRAGGCMRVPGVWVYVYVCICGVVCVCVCNCARTRLCACGSGWVGGCGWVKLPSWLRACMRACLRMCVRGVHACGRVRACVCVCVICGSVRE